MPHSKFRLITRSDFDGLVCAVLLKEMDLIDDIKFVHPKDMQDGKIEVSERDITTNLPYVPGVHLCFDHHASETMRNEVHTNHFIDPDAQSAARVVFDHYGGVRQFGERFNEMMAAVDKGDAAQFSADEILNPSGWVFEAIPGELGLASVAGVVSHCVSHCPTALWMIPDPQCDGGLIRQRSVTRHEIARNARSIPDIHPVI